jgi:hypothetical protein
MMSSIHDNLLISYEVHCENRTIVLRTEYREDNKPTEFTNVAFSGVQGYHFENDAFGNIILDLQCESVEWFIGEYGTELRELHRMSGTPGPWVENLGSAPEYMREKQIKAFVLSSSVGLSGWILAKEVSFLTTPRPSDESSLPAPAPKGA